MPEIFVNGNLPFLHYYRRPATVTEKISISIAKVGPSTYYDGPALMGHYHPSFYAFVTELQEEHAQTEVKLDRRSNIDVEGVAQSDFHDFYQADTHSKPDNETDHLLAMENLNTHVRSMLEALEYETKVQMKKLQIETVTLGLNVLHSAQQKYRKYAHPERYAQYMSSGEFDRFLEAHREARYYLEKIDYIFQKLPGLML